MEVVPFSCTRYCVCDAYHYCRCPKEGEWLWWTSKNERRLPKQPSFVTQWYDNRRNYVINHLLRKRLPHLSTHFEMKLLYRMSVGCARGILWNCNYSKSQALNAHNFSLLVLSNFDKPTWPPSCPMVGSLRVFLFCSPCSAPLTSSPFDCPLCWFLPVTRSARSPAGTPGTWPRCSCTLRFFEDSC